MKCTQCGAEIGAGQKFCVSCGAPAPAAPAAATGGPRFCTQCGAQLAAGNAFCTGCGAPAPGGAGQSLSPQAPQPAAPPGRPYAGQPVPPPPPGRAGRAPSPRTAPPKSGGSGALVAILGVLLALLLAGGGYLFWKSDLNPLGKGNQGGTVVTAPPPGGAAGQGQAPAGAAPGAAAKPAASPTAEAKPVLGKADVKEPEPAKIVKSKEFGEAPANQVAIVMKDGQTRQDAEKVAAALGGSIVGEIEMAQTYQIETKGANEADLKAAIAKAEQQPGVEAAFANSVVRVQAIPCQSCSPLSDPFFGGGNGAAYGVIGVKRAWDIIKASGVKLSNVQVGVADTQIYSGSTELKGSSSITSLEADDRTDQPNKDNAGNIKSGGHTHGTQVTHVIAANPDNGGMAGVASILGNKLSVTHRNLNMAGQQGFREVEPPAENPNDPRYITYTDGKTYTCSGFRRIVSLIESGATIINYSWGPDHPDPALRGSTAAYRIFLRNIQRKYPKVLFVAAAGNEGTLGVPLDGKNYEMGGQKLANVITVGAVDNNGNKANFSNWASGDGEVTISAPGVQVPVAVGPDGKVVKNSGTSFATPMVTSAAAILRSINPELTAEQIKKYLADSAAPGVPGPGGNVVPIAAGMGKGVLRVDEAVLKVINDMLPADKKLDPARLEKLATIEGSATNKTPKDYTVKAKLEAVGPNGTDVKVEIRGGGATVTGAPSLKLTAPGEVTWEVTLQDEKKKPTIRVCRLDTEACCDINLEVIDLNGNWTGTWVIKDVDVASDVTIPDPFDDKKPPTIIKKEDCEKALKEAMNKENAIRMEFTATSPEAGTVVLITKDDKGKENRGDVTPYKFDGSKMTIDSVQKGATTRWEGTVTASDKEYKMEGSFTLAMEEKGKQALKIAGTFSVTKPKEAAAPAGGAPAKPKP